MTALEMSVMRRKGRRTHLLMPGASSPMCGTRTALTGADHVILPLIGGATRRLRNDLEREMDSNSCIPCTRITLAMLALYASRDTGKAV